jgi:hypothetical protein
VQRSKGPQCLFFCTLNSHFPWLSPLEPVDDWRVLNDPGSVLNCSPRSDAIGRRCADAVRYQLDYILQFAAANADDDPLVIVFGDHQPPLITAEAMGKHTPVHVISKNPALLRPFYQEGFVPALSLGDQEPRPMRHEGFLSLFLKGMQAAYGTNESVTVKYRAAGVPLFDGP